MRQFTMIYLYSEHYEEVSITRVKRLYLCCIQINVVDSHFGEHFLCVVIHTNDKHRLCVSRRCFFYV